MSDLWAVFLDGLRWGVFGAAVIVPVGIAAIVLLLIAARVQDWVEGWRDSPWGEKRR